MTCAEETQKNYSKGLHLSPPLRTPSFCIFIFSLLNSIYTHIELDPEQFSVAV